MPTWTITQYLHQNTELEATPCVKTCQQDSERFFITMTGESSSGQLAAAVASSSAWPVVTEDPSCEKKVHLQSNTDGDKYIRKFDDRAKKFKPQSQEEHEFLQPNIGQYLCKHWEKKT